MARLVVKNMHQADTRYDEIELCAQTNLDNTLGSKVNTIERAYVIIVREPESSLQPLQTFASQLER